MASVNERLADAAVSHAVDLAKYSNGVVRRIVALLNRSDIDITAALLAALERLPAESFSVERLEALLGSVRGLNAQAYALIAGELEAEMRRLTEYEAGHQLALFQSVIPAQVQATVAVAAVNVEQVYTAALARPMQGRLLREWASGLSEQRMIRVRDALRMGYVQNETVQQMVNRVRGTRARAYKDGLLEISRRDAQSVVLTATSHFAGVTRERFHNDNTDLIASLSWTSAIDLRTTEICRVRDGKRYTPGTYKPIGHSIPWLAGPGRSHWRCRSVSVPVTKSWRELGFDVDEMDPGTRSSMDGQVPAEQSYGQWLQKQSAKRQDEVVGPTRGRLMRSGELPFDSLYSDRGEYLSLDQLRERDAAAFRRAGL